MKFVDPHKSSERRGGTEGPVANTRGRHYGGNILWCCYFSLNSTDPSFVNSTSFYTPSTI